MSDSPCPSAIVKFSNLSNSIPDSLTDILANPFRDFSIDVSSNLAVALVSSFAMPFLFDLPVFG